MNKTKACLEITLEQARKWYESGNEDLKNQLLPLLVKSPFSWRNIRI